MVAPDTPAAVQVTAMAPAAPTVPDILRQGIFVCSRFQAICGAAQRRSLRRCGKHAERNGYGRATQPTSKLHCVSPRVFA